MQRWFTWFKISVVNEVLRWPSIARFWLQSLELRGGIPPSIAW